MPLLRPQLMNLYGRIQSVFVVQVKKFHNSPIRYAWQASNEPKNWLKYNEKIYPPQQPGSQSFVFKMLLQVTDGKTLFELNVNETDYNREQNVSPTISIQYVCHQRANIKYSPWKMWYIATFVRGMSVDEAVKQLKFVMKKGAKDVRETIEEAKELAVKEHNVEYASNLWVAESFVGKGPVVKGIRRHARKRPGRVEYFHCHYFVRLEEGSPPKHYYQQRPKEPHEQLQDWLQAMRKRKITNSL